jgi:hypothetical protein
VSFVGVTICSPQGSRSGPASSMVQILFFRNTDVLKTRSLWDPSYTDPSIHEVVRLIPRMRDWVNTNYPGTKISLSEHNWGNHNSTLGVVTYAQVFGIFGREGLDAATVSYPPLVNEVTVNSFVLILLLRLPLLPLSCTPITTGMA